MCRRAWWCEDVQGNLGTWQEGAWTRRRLAALAARDATCWAFALPWLLETVERFPTPLAHLMAA